MTGSNGGPLAGTRVVDLTRILAGPLCTMMLGDMGADIIKVEPPGTGDDTRGWGPPFAAGEAAYFLGVNRNKRSLTLNMAAPPGQKVLAGLIGKADVLIDNFDVTFVADFQSFFAEFEQSCRIWVTICLDLFHGILPDSRLKTVHKNSKVQLLVAPPSISFVVRKLWNY